MRGKCDWVILFLLVTLLTACADDDSYYYPSVKLEFLTAHTGADGSLQSILTDEGKTYMVVEDASQTKADANTSIRIVSNYGVAASNNDDVKLYGVMNAISPIPKTAEKFNGGVKTDPADVLSIWMGLNYLNVVLDVKAQKGKHLFHFVEDDMDVDQSTGHGNLYLTLYHDDANDVQAYSKRAYLSVPLQQYTGEGIQKLTVHFSLRTYKGDVKTYKFDYTPSL